MFIRYEHIRCVHRVLTFELVQHKCLLLIPEFTVQTERVKFTSSYFKIRIAYGHKMKASLRLRPLSNARLQITQGYMYICLFQPL